MSRYLMPLWIFVSGQIFALGLFLILPYIGTAGENLYEATADAPFWGWEWVTLSVRLTVVVLVELVTLLSTAVAFIRAKKA